MYHKNNRLGIRFLATIVLLTLALSACANVTSPSAPETAVEDTAIPQPPATATPVPLTSTPTPLPDLGGTYWILLSYVDADSNTALVLPNTVINVEFTAEQITGSAGCNRYFAAYQIDGDALTFGPIGATKMACGESVDRQEIQYFNALESVGTYNVEGDHLHLINAEGTTVLAFEKSEPDAVGTSAWTADVLKNATYTIEDLGDVQLVNGEYAHQYGDGATMVDKVGVVDVALGDLDGDGNDDAAVILWWQSGGSGTFLYLAAMRNADGVPQQASITSLGDRVQPGAFAVTDGAIALEVLAHGPDDPMCCPSQKVIQTYVLEGDALTLVSSEMVSPELAGTVWTWVRFEDTAGKHNIIVDDPSRYTLEFLADGNYKLRADCNQSRGSYTFDGNNLTLGPGPMTLAECGPESLYDEYVTNLGDVVSFAFDGDALVLSLKMDAGTMVFVEAE